MKKYCVMSALFLIFSISSCSSSASEIVFKRYTDYKSDVDTYAAIYGEGYYKPAFYNEISYENDKGNIETIKDFDELYRDDGISYNVHSVGKQNILVIPVDFSDYPCSGLSEGCTIAKTNIENAFFGSDEMVEWESVASFYNKSSYGKLILDGKVTDWFTSSSFTAQGLSTSTARYGTIKEIRREALEWYSTKYSDIANYYIDGDVAKGVALYLIYDYPYDSSSDSRSKVFWAYTISQPCATSWSSYTLCMPQNGKVDSHTYIHETGHLFGLTDYYNTNNIGGYGPTGRLDMMDYTIGDHTGYSKMLLNWTRPYVITGNATLTICPFTSSGDLILIKNSWNGSSMDEYLLLEFYVPEGLNQRDDSYLVSQCGVKVYHVDSRIGFSMADLNGQKIGYIDNTHLSKDNYHLSILNNNSDHTFQNNKLYTLLESSGYNTFESGGYASNATLFKKGSSFGFTTFKDYQFNDGGYAPFKFTIDSVTNTYATISFIPR
ncbi:MAG: hypothetical protein WC366_03215 [Bacilli bacterium]|jgi:M6 family metalloprotease-like protein